MTSFESFVAHQESLASRVEAAFRSAPPLAESDPIVAWPTRHDSDEISSDFRGCLWSDITFAVVSRHRMNLPLLLIVAFAYFLPAFLVQSLRYFGPDDDALEFAFYSLTPPEDPISEWYGTLLARVSLFDRDQWGPFGR